MFCELFQTSVSHIFHCNNPIHTCRESLYQMINIYINLKEDEKYINWLINMFIYFLFAAQS